MISNATLLTPRLAQKLAEHKLRSVQVTFDGDRDEHDRIRVRRSLGGTFDAIVTNISRASEVAPIRWSLRVNFSHHNYSGISTLIEQLAERLDPARCSIYFARVGDVGIGYANEFPTRCQLPCCWWVSWPDPGRGQPPPASRPVPFLITGSRRASGGCGAGQAL
jgi:hypothetical protein